MLPDLIVTPISRSRLADVDFENLGFGNVFSDHMFSMTEQQNQTGRALPQSFDLRTDDQEPAP